jgi:hypothetical protein
MKKIMPFIVFLCCFGTVLHAQLDTFNLSRYKLPDIKFRQLDLRYNLSGNNSLSKNKSTFNSSKFSTIAATNDLNIAYRSYRNSEHLQNEQEFTIGFGSEFKNNKDEDEITYKYSNVNPVLQFNSDNRFYNQHQFFFETDFHIYGSGNWEKTDDKVYYSLTKSDNISADIEVPLLIGHGRIEQIQDARLAIYILEELQKAGRISRVPGGEELMEFSRLISTMKNERYFDYRIKKMEEIEKVDSFLQAKGIITLADARYFTIVNDNWDYAQGPIRESGKRLSGGLIPSYSYYYSNLNTTYSNPDDTSGQKNKIRVIGIGMQGQYKIEKPVNLHWQRSFLVKLSYGYFRNMYSTQIVEESENKSNSDLLVMEAGINYGMGFYPNSRTDISGQVSLDFQHSNRLESEDRPNAKSNGNILTPDFSLVLHYYISPQVRLNINYHINYNYNKDNLRIDEDYMYFKTNSLYQNFNVGLVYSFF